MYTAFCKEMEFFDPPQYTKAAHNMIHAMFQYYRQCYSSTSIVNGLCINEMISERESTTKFGLAFKG